ncbi:MAG: IMPACT family protein [Bacteroidia bacterium]
MPFFEIHSEGESLLKDRGSKFYGFAFPVKNVEEVETHLASLRKKFYDARHHCFAYRLGKNAEASVANDDGEPAHSAGTPILNQLRSAALTNVLVVVIRYFGGTLLGVRGLIEAYAGAANLALASLEKQEIIPTFSFEITFPYEKTSDVNRVLHRYQPKLVKADYTDICVQQLQVHKNQELNILKDLEAILIQVKPLTEPE